ncbi:AAA family ATPase [Campylobacter pinnipediorum]|uniref:AAA family ATPase n=1 Tax=Campylobacter pinnipediorum TaxID=1965231 RepID=UPI00084DC503|nr:AAA family ATPase [Campylobacter pinnipediorum]
MEEYDLRDIAIKIKEPNKKVSLLYAFNATGKTRLSMEFKDLTAEIKDDEIIKHTIYYNAFTEDLFYWDNDLENDSDRKLKINKNSNFIELIERQGKENEIAKRFKEFTSSKIEPNIDISNAEITFSLPTGDNKTINNIKISKGEESIFIWTVFFVLMETIISELNNDVINDRSTDKFNAIEYIFIDDPVTSLDDNHLINLAILLKEAIVKSKSDDLKFIITTHHALFYNVLLNEFKNERSINDKKKTYLLLRKNENKYSLVDKQNDTPFGYHLFIKDQIKHAIKNDRIERYHFMLFRNLLEKTSTYLGYNNWGDLIFVDNITDEERKGYIRIINLFSHNKISDMETKDLKPYEKNLLKLLFENFLKNYKWKE